MLGLLVPDPSRPELPIIGFSFPLASSLVVSQQSINLACHYQSLSCQTTHLDDHSAPEPTQVGDYVITQKGLYIALFVIGLPLLYIASYVYQTFVPIGILT